MSDDDTVAGQAPDEPTTGLPTAAAVTPELAWSLDDEPDVQRQPWRTTWGIAGVIAACSIVIAGVTGLVLWVSTLPDDVPPLPLEAQPTTTVAQPVTTVTVTAATPEDRDATFVAQVRQNLPPVFFDRPVESAQNLCRELVTGDQTKRSAMASWVQLPYVTVEKATFWWNIATTTYCPQYQ